jgi:hypothetical protein
VGCIAICFSGEPNAAPKLKLILTKQIASNFSSFFEKLLTLLDNVAAHLPRSKEIEEFCTEHPTFTTNLRLYVEKLYGDLFELFCAVAKVYLRE